MAALAVDKLFRLVALHFQVESRKPLVVRRSLCHFVGKSLIGLRKRAVGEFVLAQFLIGLGQNILVKNQAGGVWLLNDLGQDGNGFGVLAIAIEAVTRGGVVGA